MIIGMMGFAGSGKGTAGELLVKKGFKAESFAAPVKDAVSVIFGWDRALLEGDTAESRLFRETKDDWWSERLGYDVTPRLMMQYMGTEAGRNVFGEPIWVSALMKKAAQNENTVVTDCRFPNEMKAIRDAGGILVRVKRGEEPEWFEMAAENNDRNPGLMERHYPGIHFSEWAWIGHPIDVTIENNGTFEDLELNINKVAMVAKWNVPNAHLAKPVPRQTVPILL